MPRGDILQTRCPVSCVSLGEEAAHTPPAICHPRVQAAVNECQRHAHLINLSTSCKMSHLCSPRDLFSALHDGNRKETLQFNRKGSKYGQHSSIREAGLAQGSALIFFAFSSSKFILFLIHQGSWKVLESYKFLLSTRVKTHTGPMEQNCSVRDSQMFRLHHMARSPPFPAERLLVLKVNVSPTHGKTKWSSYKRKK